MLLPVVTYPDPRLAQKSAPVTEVTEELRAFVKNMVDTMYEEDGIGLAAPQVGDLRRIIVVDITGPEKREELRVYLNPVIEPISEANGKVKMVEGEEGCLSVPNCRSKVSRAERIHFTAEDLDGNKVDFEADGLLSICLQHETDHLNGVLFIDRISRLKRSLYDNKVKKWLKRRN